MELSLSSPPPPSPLSYLRVVQQLQKKTEEVKRVFDEARRLERENAALVEENAALAKEKAELVRNVETLEAQSREWRAEFGILEAQVKEQQRHLQEHIEKEAKRLQENVEKTRENESWHRECLKAVQERAAMATERDNLAREIVELKSELKAAKMKAAHYRSTHERVATEKTVMEEIENKALKGVKSEIASFAAENERLLSDVNAERKARLAAEESVANLQQLLQRQREVSVRQQLLAKQEMQALNMQNDALLDDIKHLMEREAKSSTGLDARREVVKNQRQNRTIDCGTMTTEVHYTPLWSSSPAHTQAPTLEHGQRIAVMDNKTTKPETRERISDMLEKIHHLQATIANQALTISEKEEKELVFEKQAALYQEEIRNLRELLKKSSVANRERDIEQWDNSRIVRAEAETELSAVLEGVMEVQACFIRCANTLRDHLALKTTTTDFAMRPLATCHEYNSPHLNAIFSHLENLRNIALVIEKIGEAAYENYNTKQKQKISPLIKEQNKPLVTTTLAKGNETTKEEFCAAFENTQTKTREISTWLKNRKKNLENQLQQSKTIDPIAPKQTSFSFTTHLSAETLAEATKQLHEHIYLKRKKT